MLHDALNNIHCERKGDWMEAGQGRRFNGGGVEVGGGRRFRRSGS